MKTKLKRVVVYARVSTAEQTVETQLLAIRKYCEAQGWEVSEIYSDEGISGAQELRPALDRLKSDVSKGKVKAVVVYKLDRLARSVPHLLSCLEHFRTHDVGFVSVSESVDTTTPVGRMVTTFLAAIAEFERALIQERVLAGVKRAQAAGTHCGRPRKGINIAEAVKLQQQGLGVKQISKRIGIPRSTVHRALQSLKVVSQKSRAQSAVPQGSPEG